MRTVHTLILLLWSVAATAAPPDLLQLQKLLLVNGCRLFSLTGDLVTAFPGTICVFLPDGAFVSATETHLRYFSKDDEIRWELPGNFHHQINLSADGKRILALSSALVAGEREDKFLVVDLAGRVLHAQTALPLLTAAKLSRLHLSMAVKVPGMDATTEISHFNSIYEIPPRATAGGPAYLRPGNVVVNSTNLGIFVLTPDLQTLLHHSQFPSSRRHQVHDVQVTRRGTYLFFNNLVDSGQPQYHPISGPVLPEHWSAVEELDPRTLAPVHRFEGKSRLLFYSPISSNVQEVTDDVWLFTHVITGTYLYSKSRRDVFLSIPGTHYNARGYTQAQQVRAENLTDFLRARGR
jgi:hypothetical protein